MIELKGKGVSKGVAVGKIRFFVRSAPEDRRGLGAAAEKARFLRVQAQTAARLENTAAQCGDLRS